MVKVNENEIWTKRLPLFAIFGVILIFVFGFFLPRVVDLTLVLVVMVIFLAIIGKAVTDDWRGILINERGKMTLSRFQLVIWTLIVLSAFITIALKRIAAGADDPLAIAIPEQLWILLGISTTSLVGSPLILNTKKDRKPPFMNKEIDDKIANGVSHDVAEAEIAKKYKYGLLAFNEDPKKAKFSDIFKGDEKGNEDFVDMAKVQMFFFTLIIAFTYMLLLINLIYATTDFKTFGGFPPLDDGLVALLGISSGGYLGNKVYDKPQK
jgi:hypothetical protein